MVCAATLGRVARLKVPRSSRFDSRTWSRPARIALAALVVASPLLLGGVPSWAPAVLAPFGLVALVLAALGRSSVRLSLFAGALAAMVGLCALQLLPLPPALLSFLSPPSAALRDFALVPVGLTSWRPISLDAPATWRELSKATLLLSAFFAAGLVSSASRSSRPFVLSVIALTGPALVLSAFAHAALGIDELFGLYQFSFVPRLLTPFGNPNHLAGFLILCGTLCAGLSMESRSQRARLAWLSAWAVTAIGVLLSLSRGGIAAFCLAQVFFLGASLWFARRARRIETGRGEAYGRSGGLGTALRLALAGTLVLGAAAAFLFERLSDRFTDTATYALKLDIWPHALEAAKEHWRTGMGRGAFELGFTRYPWEHLGKTYTHPESWPLQLLTELGVPLAVALVAVAGFAFIEAFRRSKKTPLELAVLCAVAFVVVQNLVDFNLEFPGVAVPLTVALGVLVGSVEHVRSVRLPIWPSVAVIGLVAVVGGIFGRGDLRAEEQALLTQAQAAKKSTEVKQLALDFIDRHPHDYLPWMVAAVAHLEKPPIDARNALAFATRALYLAPHDFQSHQVAAVALASLGQRGQALLEYRLAWHMALNTYAPLDDCLAFARGADELQQCVSLDAHGATTLVNRLRKHEQRVEVVRGFLKDLPEPDRTQVAGALAEAAVTSLMALGQEPKAQALIDEVAANFGPSPQLALASAEAARQAGKTADALERLEAAQKRWPTDFDVAVALARALMAAGKVEAARAAVLTANASTTEASKRAELKALEAECDVLLNRRERGLEGLRAAARLQARPEFSYRAAQVLMSLGRIDEAWAEVRAGQRADTSAGAVAADERFKQAELAARSAADAGMP